MASGRSHEDTRFWNPFLLITMLLPDESVHNAVDYMVARARQ